MLVLMIRISTETRNRDQPGQGLRGISNPKSFKHISGITRNGIILSLQRSAWNRLQSKDFALDMGRSWHWQEIAGRTIRTREGNRFH